MRMSKYFVSILLALALMGTSAMAAPSDTAGLNSGAATTVNQVIDRVAQNERHLVETIRKYHPMVETYLQNTRPDAELGSVPVSDKYFLGRLYLTNTFEERFYTDPQKVGWLGEINPARRFFKMDFLPIGFAGMIFPDVRGLDRRSYDFQFLHREFLGDVRCLVFQVVPKPKAGVGRFMGRIWVEDQGYNVVRFNGTYTNPKRGKAYFHMDSWRSNLRPGLWLPSEVYSEESGLDYGLVKHKTMRFKAQTRLWGYDVRQDGRQEELTQVLIDKPGGTVKDESDPARDWSPVNSLRTWQREAEENVLDRMQAAALLAPRGPVDKILETVVSNLEITNNLDIEPKVQCRVLLTTPLESFTVGHTIIVSRGLLDVLPDEASLAMVLSHELAHLALGEQLDTQYGFSDRMLFADQDSYRRLGFKSSLAAEKAADARALELLKNSPYKDKLASAGLFLRQLQERSAALSNLLLPRLGDGLVYANKTVYMSALMNGAPALQMLNLNQIAALPLGGRIKMDPWNDRVELMKTQSVRLQSVQEKMPFEVAPVIPRLTRLETGVGVAMTSTAAK